MVFDTSNHRTGKCGISTDRQSCCINQVGIRMANGEGHVYVHFLIEELFDGSNFHFSMFYSWNSGLICCNKTCKCVGNNQ